MIKVFHRDLDSQFVCKQTKPFESAFTLLEFLNQIKGTNLGRPSNLGKFYQIKHTKVCPYGELALMAEQLTVNQ